MHLETPGLHAVWQASIRATAPIVDATGSSRNPAPSTGSDPSREDSPVTARMLTSYPSPSLGRPSGRPPSTGRQIC